MNIKELDPEIFWEAAARVLPDWTLATGRYGHEKFACLAIKQAIMERMFGGRLPYMLSVPEQDEKNRIYGEYCALDKDIKSGYRYSRETCVWATKSQQSMNRGDVTSIVATSPEGNSKEFSSIKECAEALGLDRTDISRCLSGKYKQTKGYTFQRRNEKFVFEQGADQLKALVETLKKDPNSRRMVCSAWNPLQAGEQALLPCHVSWQVLVIDNKLHLNWFQRSVDTACGLPFNMASYATLTHLLAADAGLKPGTVTGFLGDTHIYRNHKEGVEEMVARKPAGGASLAVPPDASIFAWDHTQYDLQYFAHPPIKFDIAV